MNRTAGGHTLLGTDPGSVLRGTTADSPGRRTELPRRGVMEVSLFAYLMLWGIEDIAAWFLFLIVFRIFGI